ncbi:hypothetical protein WA026_020617 [Henosepilachna vigintioctopunctata]|uniref:DH domain-containing protein n=1 Tax=Henosepilachna vigintioctopunctata TaxID=420089 RepID=A0AAW1V4Q9_9CUCU
MENTLLRRMNLNSFLMVPVQRVTKYPLLLARLYKVTPNHNEVREQLREAQHKIELHLNHMNSQTKDVPSKLWRRIGSNSGRRSSTEMDLNGIMKKLNLPWKENYGLLNPQITIGEKEEQLKLSPVNALLVINGKPTNTTKAERMRIVALLPLIQLGRAILKYRNCSEKIHLFSRLKMRIKRRFGISNYNFKHKEWAPGGSDEMLLPI